MRSFVPAAALATLLIAGSPARAQDADQAQTATPTVPQAPATAPATPPSPSGPGPSGGPIPYTALAPKSAPRPRPAAKPAPKPTSLPPTAASAVAAAPAAPAAHVAGARLQPGQAIPPGELAAFVDGVVRAAMARDHTVGATVAVVQNGQVLLKKGYGAASLSPVRPVDPDRTLFRLGSISKTFTWIGLMKQVEAGRIRLDQPVNAYLPEWLRIRDEGFDQPIRVVDLMDHSAGFEDRLFDHVIEQDPDYVRPLDLYLLKVRPRRVRPPGVISSYSNYSAGLAGAAEAQVAGKTFERLMEDEIFLPLGMRHTTFRERRPAKAALPAPMPEALAADLSEGFHWSAGGVEPSPYEYMGQIAPAASASSTAGDMARYMLALLGGGQSGGAAIYGPRTAQAFRTPILATPPGINGWAHGFLVEPMPGGRQGFGHDGGTLAFTSNMVMVPDLGLGVFVAVNTDSGHALPGLLPTAIVREFYAVPDAPPRAGSPELAQQAGIYDGRFLSTRRAYSGLEGFVGQIFGTTRVRVTPDGRLVTVDRTGPQAWVPEGAPGEGRFIALQGEERLVFRMADGRAEAFQTSGGAATFERISFWRSIDALKLSAALTAAAAALTLIGTALRNRRELRESAVQSRASLVQNLQAGLWLAGIGSFLTWLTRISAEPARAVLDWPGAALVSASACGLVAAALTATTVVILPAVWRGGRRVDSWPASRRLAYTVTTLIYAVFAVLLARAGALSPWS